MNANLWDRRRPAMCVDRQERSQVVIGDREPVGVETVTSRQITNRCLYRIGHTSDAFEDPLQHTTIFSVTGPQVAAVVVAAEPVDEEDLG